MAHLEGEVTSEEMSVEEKQPLASEIILSKHLVKRSSVKEIQEVLGHGRGNWKSPFDFFVTCLGYAVGLGNIWRFPFLCYEHGGGSFLIPYFTMLIFAGLPVFMIEIAIGQYASCGPVKTFAHIKPALKGLGYAMVSVGAAFAFFYIVVVSWALWFLLASFQTSLAWGRCDNDFNTDKCQIENGTLSSNVSNTSDLVPSTEEYWNYYVLGSGQDIPGDFGTPRWQSATTLFLSWLLVALCFVKGIKIAGKISYVTSFFPYIILIALAARSFTMPGALNGLKYFILPKWEKLATISIWTDAATQTIFSLGPGCGCVLTLSSYNKKDKNCFKDAVFISMINCLTSIFCGVVVFSMLGFMAHESGKEVDQVVMGGPGLAFIVYPEIVTKMSLSNMWSVLFFTMLILLAMGSIFGAFETVIAALSDHISFFKNYKKLSVFLIAGSMFLFGLPYTCPGGIHFFTVFNYAAPSWNLLLITLLELVSIAWIFKAERLLDEYENLGVHIGVKTRYYWIICWKYLSPLVMLSLLIMSWINFGSVKYGPYTYPLIVQVFANILTAATVALIPLFAIIATVKQFRSKSDEAKSNSTIPPAFYSPTKDLASEER